MTAKENAIQSIRDQEERYEFLAREIWGRPEVALQETFASKLLAKTLEESGFEIEWGLGGMPTAFSASWGQGGPAIGLLGEYDALPGLSQNLSSIQDPISKGGPGHGCGHNLFGTACLAAALALKETMDTEKIPGTIRFFGCPAEETLVGKVFMARAGAFDDLDAALTWHPGTVNMVTNGSSLALNSFKVNFSGTAAHAGVSPEAGRSALDAVLLMDVGVNYLREHIIPDARIHSVITAGGQAPNVVPAFSQVWYFVRAPERDQVDEIYERVLNIAEGAALMTGTRHEIDFLTGCYNYLPNKTLSSVLYQNMLAAEPPSFSENERAFAGTLQSTFPAGAVGMDLKYVTRSSTQEIPEGSLKDPLWESVLKHAAAPPISGGSTEVGDVSWIAPTGQFTTTCWPFGTPAHSWQTVSASGSSIGVKGMLFAARILALTSLDLFMQPELCVSAKKDFIGAKVGKGYITPLPDGASPR